MWLSRLSARSVQRPLLACAIVVVAAVVGANPVGAWCNPNRTNDSQYYFVGWNRIPGGTVGGVWGTISYYDPYVNNDASSAWNMILDDCCITKYAQIGWLARVGSPGPVKGFWEYDDGGFNGFQHQEFSIPGSWPVNNKVLYGNTPGQFTFYANGTLEGSHCTCFTPDAGEIYGEIHSKSDQMPGGSSLSAHEQLYSDHLYYSGGWNDFNGNTTTDLPGVFVVSWIGTQQIQIWDNACSS